MIVHLCLLLRQWGIEQVLFLRRHIALDLGFDTPQEERLKDIMELLYDALRRIGAPCRKRAGGRSGFAVVFFCRAKIEPA